MAERRSEISVAELRKMVDRMPVTWIAREIGMTEAAVRKRCRKYGIATKPRGYWQKRSRRKLI